MKCACLRVGTPGIYVLPGSSKAACSECDSLCWISRASKERLVKVSGQVICFECLAKMETPTIDSSMTAEQEKEFKQGLAELQ